jgi:hypothetical protein
MEECAFKATRMLEVRASLGATAANTDIEQMIAREARKPAKIPPSDTKKPYLKAQCFSSRILLILSNEKLI